MSAPRPELIFISGPQKDQRAVIMKDVVIAGRSPSADIMIAEEHASRKQILFELTGDGWTVENLSPNPVRINGKKYKPGRQVLLDTGDVLSVGLETEILFVSAGDDPDIAVSAYMDTHAAPPPVEIPAPEGAVEPLVEPESPEPPTAGTPKSEPKKTEEIKKDEDPLAAERKAKIKKYLIGGVIYAAAMIVLVFFLVSMKKDETAGSQKGPPPRLTDEQIEKALDSEIPKLRGDVSPNKELENAINYYETRDDDIGNLYLCIRSFKLYLVYSEIPVFEKPYNEEKYKDASEKLVELVKNDYGKAYIKERSKQYNEAYDMFRMLRQRLPERQRGNPVFDVIVSNINRHIEYCRKQGKLKD